jgi:hypothetical protein
MVNGLLRLDKPCILAIVGTFHLEGMIGRRKPEFLKIASWI